MSSEGALTSATENIPNANGWVNPYRYDGRDGVRSDATTGLDWMAVRAYDPTLGRFLSRDPLGRAPLFLGDADNPYVYAGNNPLSNVDPSGQYRVAGQGATRAPSEPFQYRPPTHVVTTTGMPQKTSGQVAPRLYDQVLGICGSLASVCSLLIQALGGPNSVTKDLLKNIGVGLAIAGAVLDVADAIYTLQVSLDKGKAISIALVVLGFVTTAIGWLSNSTLPKSFISALLAIGGVVDFLAGALELAAAMYLEYGIFGEVAVDASVTAATTAAEGDVAPAVSLLSWLGGNVITYALGAMGSGLASIGESLVSLSDS